MKEVSGIKGHKFERERERKFRRMKPLAPFTCEHTLSICWFGYWYKEKKEKWKSQIYWSLMFISVCIKMACQMELMHIKHLYLLIQAHIDMQILISSVRCKRKNAVSFCILKLCGCEFKAGGIKYCQTVWEKKHKQLFLSHQLRVTCFWNKKKSAVNIGFVLGFVL